MVHTYVATMRPDGGATTAPLPPRAIASWSDAILFGRVAGCRGADLPRLIEEPAEPRTQKRQGPPEGRAMNIRPRAGETDGPDNQQLPPTQARFARPLKLATGMLVPAS